MAVASTTKARSPQAKKRRLPKRTTAAARRKFLDRLAQSANVTAACTTAKLSSTVVYALRARDAAFRADWHAALCEGYARLETELLAEALAQPDPTLSDLAVKARQYQQRLALALLAAHRTSVRGERPISVKAMADDSTGAKARLAAKFSAMAAQIGGSDKSIELEGDAEAAGGA